jgi:putative redox protein
VLAAAEHLPSVRAVATIGAPSDPEHVRHLIQDAEPEIEARGEALVSIGGRPFCIRRQFLDDLQSHDAMHERVARLGRALLVMHSPVDQTVGIEHAAAIYKAARHPKSFVSLDDADHLLTQAEDARYAADVLAAWAARYLDVAPAAADASDAPASADPPARDPAAYADPTTTATVGAAGYRTALTARGFALTADEPAFAGGTESGPTPYDYLGMALGACTAMTLRMYADRKGLPVRSVHVTVAHDRVHAIDCATCETKTGMLDRLTRTITIDGDLDDAQRARMVEIADRCPVHRTLHSQTLVETHLVAG